MKKVIYFFVCFFITTTWGCTNEKIMESNQELVKALGYEGSNSIGDAFIEDLQLSDGKRADLELLLGETRSLVLDYAEQGSNIKDGMFYAIPIRNLNSNLIEEYLLATLDMKNGVTGLDKLMIVNEDVLRNSVVNKQYESYFYIWNQSDLNIFPSVYSITEDAHAESFFKNNFLRLSGRYNVYEFKAEYSWDYSMLAPGVKKRVSDGTARRNFGYLVTLMQMECGFEPIYKCEADASSLYLLFYAPTYSMDEIRTIMETLVVRFKDAVINESIMDFAGLGYESMDYQVNGYGDIPEPEPEPKPEPNPDPWEPVELCFPEDNQLDIHRRILRVGFSRTKAFQDSLFKGDSLADSREYRSLGKSYIHALVEPGQTKAQIQSAMGEFFREQMELYFESDNAVYLGMALHPIIDSYCLGHEKRYWFDNQWHTDVIHCFEETFKLYGNEDAAISALEGLFQSIMVEGQRDVYAMFNQWLYSSYYGPLNPYNIKY